MAKLHSALTNAELHNPKGITSESTGSILALNQSTSKITASADFVPSTTMTYDLGSTSHVWQEIYVATSSINFVRPDGTIIQQIRANDSGVTFTSGSTGIVADVSGSTISGSSLHIQGNAKVTGDLTLGGKITMGDSDSDDVVMEAEFSSSLIPNNDNAFDLGTASKQWKDIYVNGIGYIDQLGTDGDPVTVYVNNGEVDGAVIGGESAAAGTFTTLVGNTSISSSGHITGSDVYASGNIFSDGNISGSSTSTGSFGAITTDEIIGNWTNAGNTVADLGTITTVDINGGTINGITDLAVADGGTGASTLTDGGVLLGSGTGAITAMAVLTDGQMIVGDGTTDPVAESGATLRTSIGVGTTDNVKFAQITGSAISSSGDVVAANGTLDTLTVGHITSSGTISGSAVYGTTIGQNRADGVKTLTIEANSVVNQDLSSDASPTFSDLTLSGGDITLTGAATDVDLIDNNSSALSFDASGKTGILEIVTTNNAEKVAMSAGMTIEGYMTASGGITGSTGHFNEIKQNTATGLHTLTLNENLTVSDGQNIVLTGAGQANTLTMNESLTVGDGNSGTITYSAASKTLTVEDSATVDQDLTKDANVQFASATLTGKLTAQEIIVSSSVSYITASFASGSNILGDSTDDTHKVTGSLQITGSGDIVGNFTVGTDSAYTLGASGTQWSNVFTDNVTLDGQGRIDLDDDLDTSIRASGDDVITIEAAGADQVAFTDGTIEPSTNDDIALGTTSKMFSDLFLGNGGVINFNNGNMSIAHVAGRIDIDGGELRNDGLISGSTDLWIGNQAAYMSSSAGSLKLTGNIVGVGNITSTGTISGSAVYGTTIGQNTGGGLKTLSIESNSVVNQDLSTDANVEFNKVTADGGLVADNITIDGTEIDLSSGDLTIDVAGDFKVDADGGDVIITDDGAEIATFNATKISGSSASTGSFGRLETVQANASIGGKIVTLAGNVTTQNNNLTINAVDAARTLTLTEDFTIGGGHAGTLTFSAGSKTLTVENTSALDQDLTSDAAPTFAGLTSTGDVVLTGQATDIDLIDNNAAALTFDAGAGGTSVLTIDTSNSAERIVVAGDVSASGDFRSISTSTGSFGHLEVATISGSGTVATLASATLSETPLDVASGGTGTDAIANKAVLISQDSGTDTIGTAVMDANGELIVGGTSGPAVMAASTIAGTGVDAATGDGTITLSTSAAQTGITSIYATDLIMGEDSETAIDFGTNNQISFKTNNAEDFRMVAGGTFHANADVVAFSSTIASDMNLKENITDMKYGLDTVMQLRGVEYDWKREDKGHDVGVLAQEVEAVVPELVKEVDGLRGKFKAVDYNKLVPILIESIKELKIELDSYKALQEIDELKD